MKKALTIAHNGNGRKKEESSTRIRRGRMLEESGKNDKYTHTQTMGIVYSILYIISSSCLFLFVMAYILYSFSYTSAIDASECLNE
jgi:hypothetical protein